MNTAILNTVAKSGSIGKIAFGLHEYLGSKGHDSTLLYGRGKMNSDDPGIIKIDSHLECSMHAGLARITGLQGCYSNKATEYAISILKKKKIEVIFIFNLHGYYINEFRLFEYLRKSDIQVVYVMLDEYPFLGKCCFSYECRKYNENCGRCPQKHEYPKNLLFDGSRALLNKKRDAYRNFDNIIFVGIEYTVKRAKESLLLKGKKFVMADEGINLRKVYYPRDASELRKKLGIPEGNKVILNVAPFSSTRKGCMYYLEAARRLVGRKDITFVHVGFDADKGICPENFIPIGYVHDQGLLSQYYSLGDLFVFTSLAETIPSACLEALSCGTPLLCFNISGLPYCSDAAHGTYVEPRNVDELVKGIISVPYKTGESIKSCREYAEKRFDSTEYFKKLEKVGMDLANKDMES